MGGLSSEEMMTSASLGISLRKKQSQLLPPQLQWPPTGPLWRCNGQLVWAELIRNDDKRNITYPFAQKAVTTTQSRPIRLSRRLVHLPAAVTDNEDHPRTLGSEMTL